MAGKQKANEKANQALKNLDLKASHEVTGGDGRDLTKYNRMMEMLSKVVGSQGK